MVANIDKAIFLRAAAGDEAAFAIIFKSCSNQLYNLAYKILKSEFWAEEVVQETFVHVWLNRENILNLESPVGYLSRMVMNRALDKIRKQGQEVRVQYALLQWALTHQEDDAASAVDSKKIDELLTKAIEALPDQRRTIYQLKYHERLSYDEIAQQLKISKHTVRNAMAKALESIRDFLAEKGGSLLLLEIMFRIFSAIGKTQ